MDLFGGWRLIDTAPLDTDVTLLVTDGGGEPYRNPHPCKRTAAGWVSSRKGTPLVRDALAVEAVQYSQKTTPLRAALPADLGDARRSPVDIVVIDLPSVLQARMAAVVRTTRLFRPGPLRAISVSASACKSDLPST
jgi:hypothetical protein